MLFSYIFQAIHVYGSEENDQSIKNSAHELAEMISERLKHLSDTKGVYQNDITNDVIKIIPIGSSLDLANRIIVAAGYLPLSIVQCDRKKCDEISFQSDTTIISGFSTRTTLTILATTKNSDVDKSISFLSAHLEYRFL